MKPQQKVSTFFTPLALLAAGAVGYALYLIFLVVPNERIMGAVQRIFYFHVASAIGCYLAFGIVFIASLSYLAFHSRRSHVWNVAAAEVGFLFCTITLASGMIWAKAAWNTWFNWEPRLITFLILWFVFLSFHLLAHFGEKSALAAQLAILGIIGALTVPFVWLSVKLLPAAAQLHPQVVENQGLKDPSFQSTFLFSLFAMAILLSLLIWLRARIGLIEEYVESDHG